MRLQNLVRHLRWSCQQSSILQKAHFWCLTGSWIVNLSVCIASRTHQICWRCKHYQYEKRNHAHGYFWLLPTAAFDDRYELKNLKLITCRLKDIYFKACLAHATKNFQIFSHAAASINLHILSHSLKCSLSKT